VTSSGDVITYIAEIERPIRLSLNEVYTGALPSTKLAVTSDEVEEVKLAHCVTRTYTNRTHIASVDAVKYEEI